MASTKTFYDYFRENMDSLGLPAPQSLFGTLTTAIATIGAMAKYVEKHGSETTVAEMLGKLRASSPGVPVAVGASAALSEGLFVVGALSAAFYAGACIGSLAVATGRSLSGGLTIADYFHAMHEHGIESRDDSWLIAAVHAHPALVR